MRGTPRRGLLVGGPSSIPLVSREGLVPLLRVETNGCCQRQRHPCGTVHAESTYVDSQLNLRQTRLYMPIPIEELEVEVMVPA